MRGNFENTRKLARFMLRRERNIAITWIVLLLVIVVGLVPAVEAIVEGDARAQLANMMENPAMIAMVGPAFALLDDGLGAMYTNLMFLFTALTVGIMNIFLIVRNTRADEEQGRYEVLRSLPVGRIANLSAAFIVAIVVNAVLSILIALSMFSLGDESMGFGGSMLWGLSLGATGLVFAFLTALFCQLSSSSRGAISYSFAALVVFYFMRAAGDINANMEVLTLISPLGLVTRTSPYVADYWWPIWIMLGIAIVIALITYRLNAIRDIDQGIIPARPGSAEGSLLLRSSIGLTFRLTRMALIWSLVGVFVLGASYAAILGEMDEFVAHNELYQNMILLPAGISLEVAEGMTTEEIVTIMNTVVAAAGFTLSELFAAMVNNMMALLALTAPLILVLRAKAEEKAIRTELILATATCRIKYLAGFIGLAFVMAALLQFVLAVGLFSVAQVVLPEPCELSFTFLFEAAMVYTPAIWVMVGLTALLIGLLPKVTGVIWAYFGYTFLVVFIGRMDVFPAWLQYTTPFGFVPQLPMDEINFPTLALLTLLAVVLTAAGLIFYRNRDINALTN